MCNTCINDVHYSIEIVNYANITIQPNESSHAMALRLFMRQIQTLFVVMMSLLMMCTSGTILQHEGAEKDFDRFHDEGREQNGHSQTMRKLYTPTDNAALKQKCDTIKANLDAKEGGISGNDVLSLDKGKQLTVYDDGGYNGDESAVLISANAMDDPVMLVDGPKASAYFRREAVSIQTAGINPPKKWVMMKRYHKLEFEKCVWRSDNPNKEWSTSEGKFADTVVHIGAWLPRLTTKQLGIRLDGDDKPQGVVTIEFPVRGGAYTIPTCAWYDANAKKWMTILPDGSGRLCSGYWNKVTAMLECNCHKLGYFAMVDGELA